MYNLSVMIPDGIAPDFEGKLKAARELGIYNLEIGDAVEGTPIDGMAGAALERLRNLLIDYNMHVALVSTGIPVDDRERLKLLFRKCGMLNVDNVKVELAPSADTDFIRRLASSYGMRLFIENRADGPWADEKALREAVERHGVGIIFNPLEFVRTERHPFLNVYYASKIKNDIGFLRVNDGLYRTHEPIALAHGCAEVKELASIMLCRGYRGYFSFTPYLPDMDLESFRACLGTFKYALKHC